MASKEVNKITSVKPAVVNLLKPTPHLLRIAMNSSVNVSKCMSTAWDLRASHTLLERGIERVKGVHHTTVMTWVKQIGELLPDAYDPDVPPQVGELDELETFVGSKKQNLAMDSR
jgi:hypothetical protein